MDLNKIEILGIARELQGIKDETEFEMLLDKWWEGKMQMQNEINALAKYSPEMDELEMFDGAYLTEFHYEKINNRVIFDKDMVEFQKRKIKIAWEESDDINRNLFGCVKKILEELNIIDLFYKEENGHLYFEGRTPKAKGPDESVYELVYEKETSVYIKIEILKELVYLWFEVIDENRKKQDIDYLMCAKTEYILLTLLPVFNINDGNRIKGYDKYKRDVNRIREALNEYEETRVRKNVNYENHIKILFTSKMANKVLKEFVNLDERAKNIFYAHVLGRMWNSIKDVAGLARLYRRSYENEYRQKYEEVLQNNEMSYVEKMMNVVKIDQSMKSILNYSNIQKIKEETTSES